MNSLHVMRERVKIEWETPSTGSKEKSAAVDLAIVRNKEMHDQKVNGFAKAVCKLRKGSAENIWQIRKVVLGKPQNQTSWGSLFSRLTASSDIPLQEMDFLNLLAASQDLIDCVYQHENHLPDSAKIIRALNKFIVNLLKIDAWPLRNEKNTIPKIIEKFQEFQTRCQSKDFLEQNQVNFKNFVSQLNKVLRKRGMSLEDISEKIVTKLRSEIPQGEPLFGRIRELIQQGTERILWPETRHDDAVVYFAKAIALHAYVYKKDADNQHAKELLRAQLDRFLELIVAYDHEHNASTLQRFIQIPLKFITWCYKGKLDNVSPSSLGALIWTFEALINNQRFIEYMQSPDRQIHLDPEDLRFLFLQDTTWESVMNLVISIGNFQLFQAILEARIVAQDRRCLLNENQIAKLFVVLNQKVQERKHESHKEMYLYFLNLLAQINRLHFLKTYAADARHIQVLRDSLSQLGFSFMTAPLTTLPSFFGNATYRAVKDNKEEVPVGENVRHALLRLFSKCGKNPVEVEEHFNRALHRLLKDFREEGFEGLTEEILGSIGEGTVPLFEEQDGRRSWTPVEQWLSGGVEALYQTLKKYTLLSLPLKWQTTRLDDGENNLDRVCLLEDKLFTVEQNASNEFFLRDIVTKEVQAAPQNGILLTGLISSVQSQLKDHMNPTGSAEEQEQVRLNRRGISRLTEKYMLFHNDKQDKGTIQRLLDLIIHKMIEDHGSVLFRERLELLAEFLNAMSPVLASLESLVKVRFFTNDQHLKLGVARELVKKAKEEGEELKRELPPDDDNTPVNFKPELASLIARQLSQLCAGDIEQILRRCTLAQLRQSAPQLEAVVERKVNELSYEPREFITSFLAHDINKNQIAEDILKAVVSDLPLKDQVIQDYGDFLKERPIPVYFLLPNQALAIELALSSRDEIAAKNLLMTMGTGQGKSIPIGLTALNEAKKIKDKPNSVVFAFTSYDHLAQRDHSLGKDFFRKDNIPSVCISKLEDVANFNPHTKIVYADIEVIEDIMRQIMLKWLKNDPRDPASESEKYFMQTIFELNGGDIRIILDEYDLLLHDLHTQDPKVATVSTSFMPEDFVRNRHNQAYCDFLAEQIRPGAKASKGIDPSTGKRFSYVPWYNGHAFNLAVGVMRLSTLIENAKRVIGFSGTASLAESNQMPNKLFFEMPSSQNPEIFETKILAKGEAKPSGDKSFISCHTHLEITEGIREVDGVLEVSERQIEEYCNAMINDIKAIRKANETAPYQRPILIFADTLLRYKKPNSRPGEEPILLWDKLVNALRAADIPLSFLPDNVSDLDLQEVAREGRVTLTTIENGRGADVRVNTKIEEGLHVIVGIPVIHERLLRQLIGRTGRMGRKGSYSIITLGNHIKEQRNSHNPVQFYQALHELTKLFVKKLSDEPHISAETRKRWLLFFTKAFSTRNWDKPQINRNHAREFFGDCSNNPRLSGFLTKI